MGRVKFGKAHDALRASPKIAAGPQHRLGHSLVQHLAGIRAKNGEGLCNPSPEVGSVDAIAAGSGFVPQMPIRIFAVVLVDKLQDHFEYIYAQNV